MADLELTNKETIIVDGYIVDAETGEVIGLAQKEEFRVKDEDSFRWVMQKILESESKIAAIDNSAEYKQAQAIIANADSMKKDAQRRLEWLLARFTNEIAEYAKPQLVKGSRSLKTMFGTVAFRTKKGGLKVSNEELAIQWAERNAPSAIKISKKFLISELSTTESVKALGAGDAFYVAPDTETVTIKTGVDQ